jgi:hypothetical protein
MTIIKEGKKGKIHVGKIIEFDSDEEDWKSIIPLIKHGVLAVRLEIQRKSHKKLSKKKK